MSDRPSLGSVGTIRGVDSVLTPELKEAWDDDGWCVLEGAIPRAEIAGTEKAREFIRRDCIS